MECDYKIVRESGRKNEKKVQRKPREKEKEKKRWKTEGRGGGGGGEQTTIESLEEKKRGDRQGEKERAKT